MVPATAAAGANPVREQVRDATELMAARRANAALARQQQNAAAQEAVPLLRKLAATRGQTANPEELLSQQIADAQDLTAARRANDALQRQQAVPLLRKLAAMQGPNAAPIDLPADFAGMLSNPGAVTAPQPEVPQVVPKQTLAQTRALVRGLALAQALKAKALGANQANEVAAQSPLIAENGGLATVANPEAGKRMAQMVSAAQAYRKLTAQPEAEEGEVAPAPAAPVAPKAAAAPAAVKKSNGKIHVETQADEYRVPMDTYHKLTDEQAAERIAQDMNAAGTVARGVSRVKVGILRNRKAISDLAAQTGAEAPNLALEQNIAAQFKGITTQKGAKAHREWLKKHYPEEAPALDKYFSDENIERIWKTQGK